MISEKVSVLLVEDNKLVKKMSIIVLEQLNCRVDAVSTGRAAIEYAENKIYDLIFMDIGLPDMCGLDVIDQIRKYSAVPIVALTAHSDKEYIAESYKMGASEFLVKPLNNDIGQAMIQRYVIAPPVRQVNMANKLTL
jgi:two-component system aerobic respiration control sensor histidine kinase ArcB